MLKVLACIEQDHDFRLLLLAALVCAIGCYTTVSVTARARAATGRARLAWGAGASIAFGACVWSTHFVAMLAYVPGTAWPLRRRSDRVLAGGGRSPAPRWR